MPENWSRPRFPLIGATVLSLAFLLTPAGGLAQSGRVYRIGVLETTPAAANRVNVDALLHGLRDAGYVEGKNMVIDYRSADGRTAAFAALAPDLVRAKPDVIVTRGTGAALAAKGAGSIPVVMAASSDPVGNRIVGSLAHPGGHVTGLTAILTELAPKRLEILKSILPDLTRIAVPISSSTQVITSQLRELQRVGKSFGVDAVPLDAANPSTIRFLVQEAKNHGVGALVVGADVAGMPERQSALIDACNKYNLPAIFVAREPVALGGLLSYGVHYPDLYYRAAFYVDKILKGAKPGDLPIEQPTKFELVINLKTAKALGVTIPREVLLRADEVIQ